MFARDYLVRATLGATCLLALVHSTPASGQSESEGHERLDSTPASPRATANAERAEQTRELLAAVELGSQVATKAALDAGADPNAKDSKGRPVLSSALTIADLWLWKDILDAGADPNLSDAAGNSPLAWAIFGLNSNAVRELLLRGANTKSSVSQGRTILGIAKESRNALIIQLVEAAAAGQDISALPTPSIAPSPMSIEDRLLSHYKFPDTTISNLRQKYRGKQLWVHNVLIRDLETDRVVSMPNYGGVWILDVVRNETGSFFTSSAWPVKVIFKTGSGKRGYVRLREFEARDYFADSFATQDPRKTFRWSAKVWRSIENREVFIGMTAKQARMAWGAPSDVNTTTTRYGTHEQWVYGDGTDRSYLYFDNGILGTIQN